MVFVAESTQSDAHPHRGGRKHDELDLIKFAYCTYETGFLVSLGLVGAILFSAVAFAPRAAFGRQLTRVVLALVTI